MASLRPIGLSNTFSQWVATTQRLVSYSNALLIDKSWDNGGGVPVLYSNTNISVGNDVTVLGNVIVTGNLVLDETNYDDLYVSGNLLVGKTLTSGGLNTSNLYVDTTYNIEDTNLKLGLVELTSSTTIDGSLTPTVSTITVTNLSATAYIFSEYGDTYNPTVNVKAGETLVFNLNVIGHPFLIRVSDGGDLYNAGLTHVDSLGSVLTEGDAQGQVSGTLYWNVPLDLAGSTYVYQCQNHPASMVGNIEIGSVYGNSNFSQTVTDYGNFETANISILVGSAVDQIYTTVNSSTAAVSVDSNLAAFTAFTLALG